MRQKHNMFSRAVKSVVEQLENRVLLSTSLDSNGTLRILGTAGPDTVSIIKIQGPGTIQVTENGKVTLWNPKAVKNIYYKSYQGDDKFSMQSNMLKPVEANTGLGRDTIVTGAADDIIYGGSGSSFLNGGNGNNKVYGKTGNQRIIAGSGNDTIDGGTGIDTVNSGTGNDVFLNSARMVKNTGAATLYQPLTQGRYKSQAFIPNVSGYSPDQIRKAYDLGPLQTDASYQDRGAGQTIYIVDAFSGADTLGDLRTFSNGFGLTKNRVEDILTIVNVGGITPIVDSGWALEINLDVQWAHAIAPAAKIVLVQAQSNLEADVFQAISLAANMASAGGGGVVSMSLGRPDGLNVQTLLDNVFAEHTNVTFVASSGDGVLAYPGGSPYVTSVGGTRLELDSQGNRIAPESAWIDAGAGPALNYERPTYQHDLTFIEIVNNNVIELGNVRGVPDVSYNADPATGVAVFTTTPFDRNRGWFSVGGTSAGAPQWAGIIATANQSRARLGKGPLGNGLNGLLYEFYNADVGSENNTPVMRDIVNGFVLATVPEPDETYPTLDGYDIATGIGTPRGDNLIFWLANYQPFYISRNFTFDTRFMMAIDTPVVEGTLGTFDQPRSGTGLLTGTDRIELTFSDLSDTNPWKDPNPPYTVPDEYFDLRIDADSSLQAMHLYRTKNADGLGGTIYGKGTVVVFNYDPDIVLISSEFVVNFTGTWWTDAAGNQQFDVSFGAVDPITGAPIKFNPYTSKYSLTDPGHGGYVSGSLKSA